MISQREQNVFVTSRTEFDIVKPTVFIKWSIIIIASYIIWASCTSAKVCSTKVLRPENSVNYFINQTNIRLKK